MNPISVLLVILVAFFAGMEGILDEFQFHQPLIACTLIGIVTGHPTEGIILGGTLQMMALGWANIGAAVAPDAALASVASAIIMVKGLPVRRRPVPHHALPYHRHPDGPLHGCRSREG